MIWSYTLLTNFENCPAKANALYIEKSVKDTGDRRAMDHGIAVHSALERRLKGTPLPAELAELERFATPFEGRKVGAEVKVGITRDRQPAGFFDASVWGRGKVDVVTGDGETVVIFDWKTGKRREDPDELEINALMLHAARPGLKRIIGHYVWLQDGRVGQAHDLSDVDRKWREICGRVEKLEQAAAMKWWPEQENPLCGWCPKTDCRFNKRSERAHG